MKNQKFEHHIAQVESDIEKFDKQIVSIESQIAISTALLIEKKSHLETLKYFLETISEETK
jgi:hypothetical protein